MESIGAYLQRERELRQVSLEELVQVTRVPLRMLQHIELDRFDDLPGDVFARGFVRSYARALGLDADEVLARFDRSRHIDLSAPPPPLASIEPPERGRRFGIALALVILVLLFTLALSIILNARQRSTPLELSRRDDHRSLALARQRLPGGGPHPDAVHARGGQGLCDCTRSA